MWELLDAASSKIIQPGAKTLQLNYLIPITL